MSQTDSTAVYRRRAPVFVHILVSVIILVLAVVGFMAMVGSKPEAKRWGGNKPPPSVAVEASPIRKQSYQVWIESFGTVEPLTQTELVSEVTGRVISVSPNIRAGSRFAKGDVLVELDARDFEVEVNIAASDAAQAKLAYLQEVAEADLAAKDWNKRPENETARLLALRQPQVEAAKAALDAANARLQRAKLNLERTRIRAPFDGMVLSQSIDVGQVVNSTQTIASIYSTDAVEVRLPVKLSELDYLAIANDISNLQQTKVIFAGELGSKTYQWQGNIVRTEGALDVATRTLFVVAQIDDPFDSLIDRPAIRVGQFLRAQIQGDSLDDVFVIPRSAVAQDNTVSVMQGNTLRKKYIEPLWTDSQSVVVNAISSGQNDSAQLVGNNTATALEAGDRVILTPVSNLPDGTRIRALGELADRPQKGKRKIKTTAKVAAGAGQASSSL